MNWIEYYFGHCWMTGWQSIRGSFRIWSDLMTGNYKDYALMWYDDPYEECVDWFWGSLGEDEVLPKEFLEYLQQMVKDMDAGKVKTYPIPFDIMTNNWIQEYLDSMYPDIPNNCKTPIVMDELEELNVEDN